MVQRLSILVVEKGRIRCVRAVSLLMSGILFSLIGGVSWAGTVTEGSDASCPIIGAEYVPQNIVIKDSYDPTVDTVNRTLSFVLRIEKGDGSGSPLRNYFLNFDAYNKRGERVSSMRFSDASSNGVSRTTFSTYWGQYCDLYRGELCASFEPYVQFHPVGVNKDLSTGWKNAPDLLVFEGTYWELTNNSYSRPDDWEKYIKFYTDEKVYPDFRFYDFWVREKCGGEK